jgi:hypothetical protein
MRVNAFGMVAAIYESLGFTVVAKLELLKIEPTEFA